MYTEIIKNPRTISKFIDHTYLKPDSKRKDVEKACKEAIRYNFRSIVVLPYFVKFARSIVKDSKMVVTVIGFPYGCQSTNAKVWEVKSVHKFVDEIDMVINRAAFSNKDYEYVIRDIKAVVEAAKPKKVKVIIESPALTVSEIKRASNLVMLSKAHCVKTAVGYVGPVKVRDVRAIKSVVGNKLDIKASGGIRDFDTALKLIKAGATILGSSHSIEIIKRKK